MFCIGSTFVLLINSSILSFVGISHPCPNINSGIVLQPFGRLFNKSKYVTKFIFFDLFGDILLTLNDFRGKYPPIFNGVDAPIFLSHHKFPDGKSKSTASY